MAVGPRDPRPSAPAGAGGGSVKLSPKKLCARGGGAAGAERRGACCSKLMTCLFSLPPAPSMHRQDEHGGGVAAVQPVVCLFRQTRDAASWRQIRKPSPTHALTHRHIETAKHTPILTLGRR